MKRPNSRVFDFEDLLRVKENLQKKPDFEEKIRFRDASTILT
jgi:hypothetical protein